METDKDGNVITQEEYYPYGGTAVLASRSNSEVKYKYIRYCGKERDATGLFYYGLRYYQPWIGRWINPDPAGTVEGQNLYRMVRNNPLTLQDRAGLMADIPDPPQEQVQGKPLKRLGIPAQTKREIPRPPEVLVDLEQKGLIYKSVEGGAILDLSERNDTEPDLWHAWDPQSRGRDNESIYRNGKSGALHGTLATRRALLGFTVIITHQGQSTAALKTNRTAAFYSLATVLISGREVDISYEKLKFELAPLLSNPINKFAEVARFSFEHPKETQTLAREAMLELVATRTLNEAELQRDDSSARGVMKIRSTEKDNVISDLENRIKDLNLGEDLNGFYEGQKFLYEYLDAEKRKELIAAQPGLSAHAVAAQESSSRSAVPRKRKTAPTGENPPSKITAPSGATGQPRAPAATMPPPSTFSMPRQPVAEIFSPPATPLLTQGQAGWNPSAPPVPQQPYADGGFYPPMPMMHAQMPYYPAPLAPSWTSMAAPLPPDAWSNDPYMQHQQVHPSGQQNSYLPAPTPFSAIAATIPHGAATVEEILAVEQQYQQQAYQQGPPHGHWGT
nr:RHS repeat-associated core domain-containing protein [Bordetella sp. LUAb4]